MPIFLYSHLSNFYLSLQIYRWYLWPPEKDDFLTYSRSDISEFETRSSKIYCSSQIVKYFLVYNYKICLILLLAHKNLYFELLKSPLIKFVQQILHCQLEVRKLGSVTNFIRRKFKIFYNFCLFCDSKHLPVFILCFLIYFSA